MKKVMIGCLLVLFISGCSSKKAETTASISSTSTETTETQVSSTDESSTIQTTSATTTETSEESATTTETTVVATTPAIIRGTWVGNNGTEDIEFTITETSIIQDGTEYLITGYAQEGNTYTINWDLNSVSNPGNPQPFIYTYLPDTDELSSGISFHRK